MSFGPVHTQKKQQLGLTNLRNMLSVIARVDRFVTVFTLIVQMDYLARKLTNLEQHGGDPKPPPPHIVAAAVRAHRKQQEGFLLGVPSDLPASSVLAGTLPPPREVDSDSDDVPVAPPRPRVPLLSTSKQRRVPKDVGGSVRRNPLSSMAPIEPELEGAAQKKKGTRKIPKGASGRSRAVDIKGSDLQR